MTYPILESYGYRYLEAGTATDLPPVVLFCAAGGVLTMFLTIYGIPWGNLSLRLLTTSVAASSFEIGLKERTFNDNFKDVMLYVSKIDAGSKELMDVFIEDKRSEEG